MALHFRVEFNAPPPEVACAWKSAEWTWNLPGGISFELCDVPYWLGPQTLGQLFFLLNKSQQDYQRQNAGVYIRIYRYI